MKPLGIYAAVILLFSVVLPAQKLRTSVDWAVFDGDADNAFIEIYYSFLQSDLNFEKAGAQYKATTLGQFLIMQKDRVVKDFVWKTETVIQDTSELKQQRDVVDRVGFLIPVGEFECKLRLTDLVKKENKDSTTWNLTVAPPSPGLHLSEIQLASTIRRAQDEESSPFYKNSLIVEPNPSLIYSYEKPALFFYLEAYNLPAADLPDGYSVNYFAQDSDGNHVQDIKPKTVRKKKVVNPSVEFGMLNVGEFKTESYTLVVEILDANNKVLTSQQKKFYTLQKDAFQKQAVVVQGVSFENSIFAVLDSADVETEYEMIFYILAKEEHKIYRAITDLAGKRQLLFGFWQSKFPTVNLNENPHRNEYFNRKRAADERFAAFKLDGWKTDRGRVLMVHGEPDDIERHPMERELYPYEIWQYYSLQGGVRFIFADLENQRNYRLVHSDLDGEVSDRNYMDTLKRGF